MTATHLLCINPRCVNHVLIEPAAPFFDAAQKCWGEWRYAEGFQSTLKKAQLSSFDATVARNLCPTCDWVDSDAAARLLMVDS